MEKSSNACAKRLMTPWLAGIIVLVLISCIFLIVKGGKPGIRQAPSLLARRQAAPAPAVQQTAPANLKRTVRSYHQVVDMIRPAVVGISLPGAQPFLQAWNPGTGATLAPYQPGTASWHCPICKLSVNAAGTPGMPPRCPRCNNSMFCPLGQNLQPGQQQVWNPGAYPSAQQTPGGVKKEEYLICPNCGIKIYQTPGIPWAGAVCPACKTVMAHVIRETESAPANSDNGGLLPFFGQQQALQQPTPQITRQPVNSIGSGIIVSRRGYILTDNHLIAGQPDITVTLFSPQGPQTFPGVVEAASVQDDLAIVRLVGNIPADLPVAALGDSDATSVGETVLAFGNPFGLAQTVTDGIISAKRQSIVIEGMQFSNIIQTDAPINQGNSGGPLVNLQGEVIGINIASYSPMQTHTGLGFAMPINRARAALAAYLDAGTRPKGVPIALRSPYCPIQAMPAAAQQQVPAAQPQVPVLPQQGPIVLQQAPALRPQAATPPVSPNEDSPAWVGVEFQLLNDVLAEQMKTPFDRGILISQVFPNSPAAMSGLERGDIIYRVDGRRVSDETQLRLFLADKKPGDVMKLVVFRNGGKVNIDLELAGGSFQKAAAQLTPQAADLLQGSEIEAGTADITSLGLTVDKITPEVAFAYSLPENTKGVLIAGVEGLAMAQGVKEGDVIVSVDGQPTPDLVSLFKAFKKGNLTGGVNLGLTRQGNPLQLIITDNNPLPKTRGV